MSTSPRFHLDLVTSSEDIDELGHVSNLVYVRWVLQVAQDHSVAVGYDIATYRDLGAAFVVRRHEIDYLRPTLAGDKVRLTTWVDSWRGASSIRETRIIRLPDGDGGNGHGSGGGGAHDPVELARGRTLWAFIDLETGRPTRIPDSLRAAFAIDPGPAGPHPGR